MRLGTIFVVICMVIIAASVGAMVYLAFGFGGVRIGHRRARDPDGARALQFLHHPDRHPIGRRPISSPTWRAAMPIWRARSPNSRGGVAAVESKLDHALDRTRAVTDPIALEIGELGTLVKQLAETVAAQQTDARRACRAAGRSPSSLLAPAGLPARTVAGQSATLSRSGAEPRRPRSRPQCRRRGAPSPARRSAGNARLDPRRHRGQPHRPLPAADRDAAAAQGSLLRGDVAAAHRARRTAARRRLRRPGGNRRPDAEDRQSRRLPLRAGGPPPAAQEPRHRPVLQPVGLDAHRSASSRSCSNSWTPTAPSRRRWCSNSRRAAVRAMGPIEHESLAALAERGFRFSLDNVVDLRIEPRELAEPQFPLHQDPGELPAQSQRPPRPISIPPTSPTWSAASAST